MFLEVPLRIEQLIQNESSPALIFLKDHFQRENRLKRYLFLCWDFRFLYHGYPAYFLVWSHLHTAITLQTPHTLETYSFSLNISLLTISLGGFRNKSALVLSANFHAYCCTLTGIWGPTDVLNTQTFLYHDKYHN